MLTYEEAVEHILGAVEPLPVSFWQMDLGSNKCLQSDIYAPISLPPFDNSQMDGYGIKAADVRDASAQKPIKLRVVGEVQAGEYTEAIAFNNGECVRIFTGAPLPNSADTVIPQEDIKVIDDFHIQISEPVEVGQFVRRLGEDVREGSLVLTSGMQLRYSEISLLCSLGYHEVPIGSTPYISVVSTGNELAVTNSPKPTEIHSEQDADNEPRLRDPLKPGQIYNSNSFALSSLVHDCGARLNRTEIARDSEDGVKSALDRIVSSRVHTDLIILSGGVSVGKYDCVKQAIQSLGGTLDFTQVSMRPGKPTVFGKLNGIPIFGLPGNPVSTMVTFELFVRPAMLRLSGYPKEKCVRPFVDAILTEDISHQPGRTSFARARVEFVDATVRVTPGSHQRSDQISGMVAADALLVIPADVETLAKDSKIKVMLLS